MAIIIKEAEKPQRLRVPSGTHLARCYSMIHVGHQNFEWQGESKKSNRIRIGFEIPSEVIETDSGPKPLIIEKEYTLSLHEKSNLRKDLESWRGKSFTSKELSNFDITKLLGIPCFLSIIHKTSNSGKEFAAITSISKINKGLEAPEPFNEIFEFNFTDKFDEDWLDTKCPSWIREQIKSSDEYNSIYESLSVSSETDRGGEEHLEVMDSITNDLPF